MLQQERTNLQDFGHDIQIKRTNINRFFKHLTKYFFNLLTTYEYSIDGAFIFVFIFNDINVETLCAKIVSKVFVRQQ